MSRPDQQNGRGLSRPAVEHDLLPGLPSQSCRTPASARQDHRLELEVERRPEDRRGTAATERQQIRSRLESAIPPKLFRLSPMSKTIPPPCPHPDTGWRYWRSLDE